jgi:hypothetical protein
MSKVTPGSLWFLSAPFPPRKNTTNHDNSDGDNVGDDTSDLLQTHHKTCTRITHILTSKFQTISFILTANEPVGKVAFLKSAPSAVSNLRNYRFLSPNFCTS